ncbi:hypothetical protein BU15DRAFT_82244 [Melanogaster broomeanus]|nr:hypothetical protein BU15DRAFT_82244 [Melanogaster broomeanus]
MTYSSKTNKNSASRRMTSKCQGATLAEEVATLDRLQTVFDDTTARETWGTLDAYPFTELALAVTGWLNDGTSMPLNKKGGRGLCSGRTSTGVFNEPVSVLMMHDVPRDSELVSVHPKHDAPHEERDLRGSVVHTKSSTGLMDDPASKCNRGHSVACIPLEGDNRQAEVGAEGVLETKSLLDKRQMTFGNTTARGLLYPCTEFTPAWGLVEDSAARMDSSGRRVLCSKGKSNMTTMELASMHKHDVPRYSVVQSHRSDSAASEHRDDPSTNRGSDVSVIPEIRFSPMPSHFPEIYVYMTLEENGIVHGSDGWDFAASEISNEPEDEAATLTYAEETSVNWSESEGLTDQLGPLPISWSPMISPTVSESPDSRDDGPLLLGLGTGGLPKLPIPNVAMLRLWAVAIELETEGEASKGEDTDPGKQGLEHAKSRPDEASASKVTRTGQPYLSWQRAASELPDGGIFSTGNGATTLLSSCITKLV